MNADIETTAMRISMFRESLGNISEDHKGMSTADGRFAPPSGAFKSHCATYSSFYVYLCISIVR